MMRIFGSWFKTFNAHHLDATSVLALEELLEYLKEKNCHVLLCEVRRDALKFLELRSFNGLIGKMFFHILQVIQRSQLQSNQESKISHFRRESKVTIFADSQK